MATIKWDHSISPSSLMTTDLNSLGASGAVLSAAFDASVDRPTHADFELLATFGSAPTAGNVISLYIVRNIDDGTNFEDASITGPIIPASGFIGVFVLRNVTTAQRMVIPKVELPPTNFKILLVSAAGQAMAASGNILSIKPYRRVVV